MSKPDWDATPRPRDGQDHDDLIVVKVLLGLVVGALVALLW